MSCYTLSLWAFRSQHSCTAITTILATSQLTRPLLHARAVGNNVLRVLIYIGLQSEFTDVADIIYDIVYSLAGNLSLTTII